MDASDPVGEIVRAVARHLRLNPLASDTQEGIAQWWLTSQEVSEADLARALERMARAGVIESTRAADGQVRYRRAALNATVDAQLDRFIAGDRLT
jgi:hypothetical protein